MSNDLLPSPDFLADPPETTATARAGPAGVSNGIGGGFLTHYPALGAHAETNGAGHAFGRADASNSDEPPMPAAATDSLAEVMATVRQAESMLQANGALATEVHFAVERIHDVAMALRMREVDAALCDTLEASIREVGDAVVSTDAAAARMQSAAVLLSDLARRIGQMIPHDRGSRAATQTAAPAPVADATTATEDAAAMSDAAPPPSARAFAGVGSDVDEARSLLRAAFLDQSLPQMPRHSAIPAPVDPEEDPTEDVSQPETSAELPLLQPAFVRSGVPGAPTLPEMSGLVESEEVSDEPGTPAALPLSQPAFVHPRSPATPSLPEMQGLVEATDDSAHAEAPAAVPLSQAAFVPPISAATPSFPEPDGSVEAPDASGEAEISATLPLSHAAFVPSNVSGTPSIAQTQVSGESTDDTNDTDDRVEPAETAALLAAGAPNESNGAGQENTEEAAAANNPQALADGQGAESLNEIVAGDTVAAAPDAAQSPPPVPGPLPPVSAPAAAAAAPANARAAAADPLAPLYALSEEELIALFS